MMSMTKENNKIKGSFNMWKDMKESKKYYCKICKRELIPRDSPDVYSEKPKISLHHIDYKKKCCNKSMQRLS